MTDIVKYDEVDLKKLSISIPERQRESYYSEIKYDNNPFCLLTSKLNISKKLSEIDNRNPYVEFEISNQNLDFYQMMNDLDEKIVRTTYSNSMEWFKQRIPLEVIDDMYKRLTKPLSFNRNPKIKFKFPFIRETNMCKIYNQYKEFVQPSDVINDTDSICIIHIRGIKFMKQQYICDCYINQMKVYIQRKTNFKIPDECLIEDSFYDSSDEEIVDDIAIREISESRRILIEQRKREIEKMSEIQKEIDNLEKSLND
mgnify:FL=1